VSARIHVAADFQESFIEIMLQFIQHVQALCCEKQFFLKNFASRLSDAEFSETETHKLYQDSENYTE
jgi:hypothetical protein